MQVIDPGTRITIVSVDMDGFLGRENHPQRSDKDLCGVVESFMSETFEKNTPDECTIVIYTCTMDDGRTLDLIHFEIKAVELPPTTGRV